MIRIGILGAGRVVQNRYLEVFKNELQNAEVTFVCDIIHERAYNAASQLNAKPVFNMDDLLINDDIDAILITTESGKHYDHTKRILNAGKHVIVEKPPALLPNHILENVHLADQKGLMYAIIFQNRFNPSIQILKRNYDSGRFGKLVLATIRLRWCRQQDYYEDGWHGTWKMDGGVINQQAIHHLDALQWICGPVSDVCSVQSNALNRLEAEDTTVATIKFNNGALGVVEATTAARPDDLEASISMLSEKGTAVIGGIALNKIDSWQFTDEKPEDKLIPSEYSQEVPTGYGLSHGPLMQEIIDRLLAGRIDPPISGLDTIPTIQLVHAIYYSSEINAWVKMCDNPESERLGKEKFKSNDA